MTRPALAWSNPAAADATGGEKRWANDRGDLTPSFAEVAGYPRLALIVNGKTILEGENLA